MSPMIHLSYFVSFVVFGHSRSTFLLPFKLTPRPTGCSLHQSSHLALVDNSRPSRLCQCDVAPRIIAFTTAFQIKCNSKFMHNLPRSLIHRGKGDTLPSANIRDKFPHQGFGARQTGSLIQLVKYSHHKFACFLSSFLRDKGIQ